MVPFPYKSCAYLVFSLLVFATFCVGAVMIGFGAGALMVRAVGDASTYVVLTTCLWSGILLMSFLIGGEVLRQVVSNTDAHYRYSRQAFLIRRKLKRFHRSLR